MAIPDPIPQKFQLRASMRQLLRDASPDFQNACHALHRWLLDHPEIRTLAVYSPLPGEIDPAEALVLHPEIRPVYPKVDGLHITFHPGEKLIPGAFGILEPPEGSAEIPLEEIDAFLCPGLAFDRNGGRLGRGRGFYDRILAQARPDAPKVGICHPFQIVDDTFPEEHDVQMDAVVHS